MNKDATTTRETLASDEVIHRRAISEILYKHLLKLNKVHTIDCFMSKMFYFECRENLCSPR